MKITSLDLYPVPPRWLFLRVATDEGIVGWGEPVVEGRVHTVAAAVAELGEYLVGRDPLRIEEHWQVLTKGGFYRGGPILSSAVAGIDQALWDIHGKALGVPVYQLLGGPVRDRVRVYSWIAGDEPNAVAEHAHQRMEQGFTAVKMNVAGKLPHLCSVSDVKAAVTRVATVRDIIGPDRDFAVDFHGRISVGMAPLMCGKLEPYQPMFIEEPILPELSSEISRVCDSTVTPIATGERLFSRWDFREVLGAGVAVVQPDVSHAGGISEVRRIAAMAETYGAALAPHCPLGPIALAASLQVGIASPNAIIQETSGGIHYNVDWDLLDYLVDQSVFESSDGYIERPIQAGLGITIDEGAVAKAAISNRPWHSPVWRHADGSLAEW